MNVVVVLLSGGLDSAVALARVLRDQQTPGPDIYALHVQHGQRNRIEERVAAEALALHYGVPLEVTSVKLWGHSEQGTCFVPGRNAVLISLAAAFGRSLASRDGTVTVVIGSNADDRRDYPDCRHEFMLDMQQALSAGTPSMGKVRVQDIAGASTKKGIVAWARSLGVPMHLTWTCYTPNDGAPCDACNACRLRAAAEAAQ